MVLRVVTRAVMPVMMGDAVMITMASRSRAGDGRARERYCSE